MDAPTLVFVFAVALFLVILFSCSTDDKKNQKDEKEYSLQPHDDRQVTIEVFCDGCLKSFERDVPMRAIEMYNRSTVKELCPACWSRRQQEQLKHDQEIKHANMAHNDRFIQSIKEQNKTFKIKKIKD